ncbi:MAG: SDR family NAD(P)-dependent oxidoreductase, partial [Gammaproteobacteria bacterium]|nr:SDR family NAD(P)-dependent oxidoreductase [Gammaproteobacteria bacterium]
MTQVATATNLPVKRASGVGAARCLAKTARKVLGVAGFALASTLSAETVLITGANSGIGLEFTRQYAEKGWDVIATHRRSSTPESLAEIVAEHDNVRIERLDVTRADDINAIAARLRDVPIDVLINNAGVYNDRGDCSTDDCPGDWSTQNFGNLRYGLFDTIMAVNVRGPLMVSEGLVEHVAASDRKLIVSISSTNGSLTEPLGGAGGIFYRASKSALNRAMQLVAVALEDRGVTVVMLHPGAVATERQAYLADFPGMIDV